MAGCSFPKSNSPIGMEKNKTSNSPIVLYVHSGESCISQLKYTIAMRGFPTIFRHASISYDWFMLVIYPISYVNILTHTHNVYIYSIYIATAPYSLIESPF